MDSKISILIPAFALIILASFGLSSHNAFGDGVIATIPIPDTSSGFPDYLTYVAVNPDTNMVYVVGQVVNKSTSGGCCPL